MLPLAFLVVLLLLSGCEYSLSDFFATATPSPTQPPTVTMTMTESPTPLPSRTPTITLTPTITITPIFTYTPTPSQADTFDFVVIGDTNEYVGPGIYDTPQYFRGACEMIANLNPGQFLISVGDTEPEVATQWTISQYLGPDTIWFPLVGNHDLPSPYLDWLRSFNPDNNGSLPPNIVDQGPPDCEETTYSFDYGNSHFVLINVYCDTESDRRTDGAIVDALYNWLADDLSKTDKEHIFVFGHEPAFPMPDEDKGIVRHLQDSLDKYPVTRDRFWALLKEKNVVAYFDGHTHSYSVNDMDGVFQVDVGHTGGAWTQATPSTFMIIHVIGHDVFYETYRTTSEGVYTLQHSGLLTP
jgi:hypothetical protein